MSHWGKEGQKSAKKAKTCCELFELSEYVI